MFRLCITIQFVNISLHKNEWEVGGGGYYGSLNVISWEESRVNSYRGAWVMLPGSFELQGLQKIILTFLE